MFIPYEYISKKLSLFLPERFRQKVLDFGHKLKIKRNIRYIKHNQKIVIKKLKNKNLQQAIYDEVRKISAKLNGKDVKKDENENIPFDEYYEEDLEWLQEEINSLNYLSCIFYFMVDETCGYTNTSDIRIIVVAG